VVEEFVYLGSLIHSTTKAQTIICATMQSLDNQIWRSRLLNTTKLRLYNMCILPIFLYGSECWVVSKMDVHKIEALYQWFLRMLLGIKWYHFVRNDDVRRQTKQPKLTVIIQARRLTLFGHIACTDDNADAKRILLASPQGDWRRPPGRPSITWLRTIQHDLRCHNLTLPEAVDMAQNRPLWRLLSMSGATQS